MYCGNSKWSNLQVYFRFSNATERLLFDLESIPIYKCIWHSPSLSLSLSISLFPSRCPALLFLGALWNAFEMHLTNGQMRRGHTFWYGLHPGWERQRPSDLSLSARFGVESWKLKAVFGISHFAFRRGKCILWSPQIPGALVCMHWTRTRTRTYVEYSIALHLESTGLRFLRANVLFLSPSISPSPSLSLAPVCIISCLMCECVYCPVPLKASFFFFGGLAKSINCS